MGSFDSDGEIRSLILYSYPELDTPYRTVEHLVNEGLEMIQIKINNESDFDLVELIEE